MAKLDKAQQQYALNRISVMATNAVNKVKYVPEKADVKALKEKLHAKGFVVSDDYNLGRYISVAKTPAQQAAIDKAKASADKKAEEIYAAAQEAKDQVMLGDSTEVTAILASLAKKLGV